VAQSGTELAPNWFATHLMDYMSKDAHLAVGAPTFVTDFEVQATYKQRALPVQSRQIPTHIGRMASTPAFCFKGCANPVDAYSTERMELIAAPQRAAAQVAASTRRAVGERASYVSVAWRADAAGLPEAQPVLPAPVDDRDSPPAPAPSMEPRVDATSVPPRLRAQWQANRRRNKRRLD